MSDDAKSGPFFQAFQRMGERMALPTPTVQDVLDHHRRNLEALQEAARNTAEGTRQAMAVQRETLETTLADIAETVKGVNLQDPPMQQAAAQTELAKRTLDATIRNATQIGGIARDTTVQNYGVLRERVEKSIEEIKSSIEKGEEPAVKGEDG